MMLGYTSKQRLAVKLEVDNINLAKSVSDRQPTGGYPDGCVLAAEERFHWYMSNFLCISKEAPLGKMVDYVWKKE